MSKGGDDGDVDGESVAVSVGAAVGLALGLLVGLGFTGFLVGLGAVGRCVLLLGLLVGLVTGAFDSAVSKKSVRTALGLVSVIKLFTCC